MLRPPPVPRAYTRNIFRHPTRFAFDSESAASAKLDPLGMITRGEGPYGVCPHAASTKHPAATAARSSGRNIEGVLQKERARARGHDVRPADRCRCPRRRAEAPKRSLRLRAPRLARGSL